MIDLILWAATKADLLNWGKTNPPTAPLLKDVVDDGETRTLPVEGVRFVWWREDGKFLTPGGTLNGFVLLLRLHTGYFDADKLADNGEQWAKSRVAKHIKDNGVQGSIGGIGYSELNGVRIFRPADVEAYCVTNGLPNHTWVGGNLY